MSNLGWYQTMTTVAKKVGGPLPLAGLIVAAGAVVGGSGVKIKSKVDQMLDRKKKQEEAAIVHTVKKDGKSKEGLIFKVGDQFKVLEVDGDAALIERIGDNNNPFLYQWIFSKLFQIIVRANGKWRTTKAKKVITN